MSAEELAPALLSQRSQRAAECLGLCRAVQQRLAQFLHRPCERGRFLAASYATIFSRKSVEQFHETRLVSITHWGLAIWLDPFGMLDSQVVVNLLQEFGVVVDLLRHGNWLGEKKGAPRFPAEPSRWGVILSNFR